MFANAPVYPRDGTDQLFLRRRRGGRLLCRWPVLAVVRGGWLADVTGTSELEHGFSQTQLTVFWVSLSHDMMLLRTVKITNM